MSTTIEWTQRPGTKGETWNPVVGCTKVSQGCRNCYAETLHNRRHKAFKDGKLQNLPQYAEPFHKVQLLPERLAQPLKWKKPRTVFVCSMADLFHKAVPFAFVDQVFTVMALCQQHTFLLLTKRPERMAEYFSTRDRFVAMRPQQVRAFPEQWEPFTVLSPSQHQHPLPNIWLGTSVEDQAAADERIFHLLRCPAAVRFLSCEPLLGPVDIQLDLPWATDDTGKSVDWVIAGGESGHGARPMHPDWARGLRDQCEAAGVPFFFKQWGAWHTNWMNYVNDEPVPVFRQFRTFEQWVNKANTWVNGGICLDKNGMELKSGKDMMQARDHNAFPITIMHKVGKATAGRLLDGREWNEWPTVATNTPEPCA